MGDLSREDDQTSKPPWLNNTSCGTAKGCYRYYMRSYRFVCVLSTHTSYIPHATRGTFASCHANLGHDLQSIGRRGSEHRGSICCSRVSLVTFCTFGIITRVAVRPVLRPCCVELGLPYTTNKHEGLRNADRCLDGNHHRTLTEPTNYLYDSSLAHTAVDREYVKDTRKLNLVSKAYGSTLQSHLGSTTVLYMRNFRHEL